MSLTEEEKEQLQELINLIQDSADDAVLRTTDQAWLVRSRLRHDPSDKNRRIKHSQKNPTTQLIWLLRDCFLAHRWKEALTVFEEFVDEPYRDMYTKWKVGSELLFHDGKAGSSLMQQFFKQMLTRPGINTQRVVIDFVTYLLKHDLVDHASSVLDNMPHARKNSAYDPTQLMLWVQAYRGITHYLQWSQNKSKLEEIQQQNDKSNCDESTQLKQVMNLQAARAVQCFTGIEVCAAAWDVFLDAYIELLEYSNSIEVAKKVLLLNSTTNHENPNSHRRLLNFYKKHNFHSDKFIPLLKAIINLNPSDCAVHKVVEALRDSDPIYCCHVLFSYLDYPCRGHDDIAWTALHSLLTRLLHEGSLNSIQDEWTERKSWWRNIQMFGCKASSQQSNETARKKLAVMDFLSKNLP